MFKLNKEQTHYIKNHFKLKELNNKELALLEEKIDEHLKSLSMLFGNPNSMNFIEKLCEKHIRFDSITGEFMPYGWIVNNNMYLSSSVNNKNSDEKIQQANKIVISLYQLSLKKLLSQRYSEQAIWKNFWDLS